MAKNSLTMAELAFGILQNVACDARYMSSPCHPVLEFLQQVFEVDISPVAKVGCFVRSSGENSHQRDKVLPVVACAAEGADTAFHGDDLAQERVVDGAVDAESVPKRQAEVQGEPLKQRIRVEVHLCVTVAQLLHKLFDADIGFQVDKRHVGDNGWSVQCSGGGFPSSLAGLVPWRGADGEALRR